ncbi:hypothetical protein [Ralstonia flatus]|uniref:hypothetical protein n=1 Tax=Ralstonia flatus TaxID=3058601 RepID=UPI00292FBB2E|nr:hypothetical protein [Ralstonia sp. LMG 32965]
MFHVFMDFMCALARLVFTVPQSFAITLDVAVLSAQFAVLLATLHVSLMLHTLRTFMIVVFRMWRRHGLRKGSSTGECKQRGKQGMFVFHGVAPLELS